MFEKDVTDYLIDTERNPLIKLRVINMYPRVNHEQFYRHHTLRITRVQSGYGQCIVGDRTYEMKAGDIFIFNNLEYHNVRNVYGTENLVYVSIHFEPQFVWSNHGQFFDLKYLKIFFDRNEMFENLLDRQNPGNMEIHKLLLELEGEFYRKPPEYASMIKVKLLSVLIALARYSSHTVNLDNESFIPRNTTFSELCKVMDYISLHMHEKITLQDLAEIIHMNPSYFSYFFKKYNGLSPMQFINRKRVFKAIEYLNYSSKTVVEIANLCGFNSIANFYKAFKSITGKLPSDYSTI